MPTRGRTIACCCAALVLLRVVIVGVALDQHATAGHHTVLPGDVRRFHQLARHRGTPYADFAVEYPPLTLAAIDALDGRTVRQATVHLMWSQVALDAVIALAARVGLGSARRAPLSPARPRVRVVPVPVPPARSPLGGAGGGRARPRAAAVRRDRRRARRGRVLRQALAARAGTRVRGAAVVARASPRSSRWA